MVSKQAKTCSPYAVSDFVDSLFYFLRIYGVYLPRCWSESKFC